MRPVNRSRASGSGRGPGSPAAGSRHSENARASGSHRGLVPGNALATADQYFTWPQISGRSGRAGSPTRRRRRMAYVLRPAHRDPDLLCRYRSCRHRGVVCAGIKIGGGLNDVRPALLRSFQPNRRQHISAKNFISKEGRLGGGAAKATRITRFLRDRPGAEP